MFKRIFFFKLLTLNFVFLNINSSLTNENADQDFSYIEDKGRREKCINLSKKGKLIFDKNSKLFYVNNVNLMGAGITYTCNNKNEIKKNKKSFFQSFGLDKATLSTDESNLEEINKSKFANFKPQQRLFCERKLKSQQLKFDESKKQYYENVKKPLGGPMQRNYICNYALLVDRKGAVESLLMANPIGNLATPLVKQKEDTRTGNPFENPAMFEAILALTKSQSFFFEALGEKQAAAVSKEYVKDLQSGSVLGDDGLEKLIIQTKFHQELINKKMKDILVLDQKAKDIFSRGIPHYVQGTSLLVTVGFTTATMVAGIGVNPLGIVQGISIFFTAKDAIDAIPLFFSSTNDLFDFSKTHELKNIDELKKAKESLGV